MGSNTKWMVILASRILHFALLLYTENLSIVTSMQIDKYILYTFKFTRALFSETAAKIPRSITEPILIELARVTLSFLWHSIHTLN